MSRYATAAEAHRSHVRMPRNPLAEVFGYPVDNLSPEAVRHRTGNLCPFHNSSGINCTKNSTSSPLGVCSIWEGSRLAVTCPIRFRQDYVIVSDAAEFFFPGKRYRAVSEVRLDDVNGKSAGNIDIVIAEINDKNEVVDFGALEVQAVYISGNVSTAFEYYMNNPAANHAMEWPKRKYPRPDYLSSSRKRLAPQLIYKGAILHNWQKKIAVAVHSGFFAQLPRMEEVDESSAEIAWFIYDIVKGHEGGQFRLVRQETQFTRFESALATITTPSVGSLEKFMKKLSGRVRRGKLMGQPPDGSVPPEVLPAMSASDIDNEGHELGPGPFHS